MTFLATVVTVLSVYGAVGFVMTSGAFPTFEPGVEGILVYLGCS